MRFLHLRLRRSVATPKAKGGKARCRHCQPRLEPLERRELLSGAFTPGDLVIYRVGDGTNPLTSTGNPVFLDEYTPAGSLVQSVPLPTVDNAGQHALIASGTDVSEGELTRSADGQYLEFTGYDAAVGGSTPLPGSPAVTVKRTVGLANAAGALDTATALKDLADAGTPRGAASTNGLNLWVCGSTGGVRYTPWDHDTSTQLSTAIGDIRAVEIFGGQLYVSESAGGIGAVGSGTPTTAGQSITNLPGLPTGGSPYAFFFAHLNPGDSGPDTLYVADDTAGGGELRKYSLVAGSWTLNGAIAAPAVRGLTGVVNGGMVTLYATTGSGAASGGGTLYGVTDTAGYNAAPSSTSASALASAAADEAFRGIALAPMGATTTTLTAAPNPSVFGQTVNLTARVSTAIGTPTGTVTFSDGTTALGTVNLTSSGTSGTAAFATAALAVGNHTITAVYSGDANYFGSTSSNLTLTVYTAAFWEGYARDAEHSALSAVASQPLNAIHWQTPVDLEPQYSGGELFIHYGAPSITPANTVILPVKTGSSGGFEINAFAGSTGSLLWSLPTDYQLPPSPGWTPSYGPVLTPQGRYYFAGNGGTLYYVNSPDSSGATVSGQVAFYGVANYNANKAAYNGTVFINTPLTTDDAGDIYFGVQVTGNNPLGLVSGIVRIAANGTATWASAPSLVSVTSGNPSVSKLVDNSAPALSNDGSVLYVAVNDGNNGVGNYGYLVALNSTTLAPLANVVLKDPSTGDFAYLPDDGTASVTVGPDGEVYMGVLENPFPHYNDRGWLLQFSADLSTEKTPGAFGWDDTVSIVPARMVPSYTGNSSYLLMTKYNNYIGIGTGDGKNKIAILDPNASENCPVTGSSNMQVMDEVETILGPSPSPAGGVAEWCINSAAVDPATDSVLAGSEDGKLYRWDLANNTLSQTIALTAGLGEAYTSTIIGPDGTVYAINNATLFAVGSTNDSVSLTDTGSNPSGYGQAVTFTVAVSGANPTGTVRLYDSDQNNAVIAYGGLTNGSVTLSAYPLPVGNHRIYAVYLGDASNNAAESNQVDQVVNKGATTTTLTDNGPNPSVTSQSVSFSVTVGTGTGPPISNETVKIEDADNGNAVVATPTLTNGTATFSVSTLSAAPGGAAHHLFAVYGGDGSYNGSQSSQVKQVVYTPLSVSELVNGAAVTIAGQSVSLAGAQRSMVDNIVVTFSRAVTLDAAALSLALHANVIVNGTSYANGYGTLPETVSVTNPSGDGMTWVVSFSGASVIGQSIADGVYDITLTGSAAHDTAVGQTYAQQAAVSGAAQNVTNTFFRLFGDSNGDVTVNNTDNRAFSRTFNQSIGDSLYLASMDFNADGTINNADNHAFAQRFNTTLSGFTATI